MFYVFSLCFIGRPLGIIFKVIMSKTLSELIEVAFDVKVFFGLGSYELHHYEDGSFVDFHVKKITDICGLLEVTKGLELKFFAEENFIIVRLFEKDCY